MNGPNCELCLKGYCGKENAELTAIAQTDPRFNSFSNRAEGRLVIHIR